ncbi:MAG: N-acetylmuramoyl-L-alanine amidase [Alphaproteobacteria bacterium]|nr:N-acetylmuramoyl-L-alanine amidase [Alphaproteobacteria bacterium]
MKELLLPYYNDRRGRQIDTLVIHASAQHNADDLIAKLVERELSAHYLVDEQGEIIRLVPEACRAWHAGVGEWRGEKDLNSTSIGIEMCNGLFGEEPFTDKQINALIELCQHLSDKYAIEPTQIIGHSDLAPARKIDPGVMFPWQKLAENGVGLWYDCKREHRSNGKTHEQMLKLIGYGTDDLEATEWAFCRHFNPALYCFLGGKKGANKGTIDGLVLHHNPQYLKTLQAVCEVFEKNQTVEEFCWPKYSWRAVGSSHRI